jgi:hypothetical protein
MRPITIIQFSAPKSTRLDPPPTSKPNLINSYEIHPSFIARVQEQSFSRENGENSYAHLQEFKQLCSCLHILAMSHETLKWKLFLFSLTGLAKLWYARAIESVKGECEVLQSKFHITNEDMTAMHMTMLRESHEGQVDKQGHPNGGGGGGLKLIRFESPRWRPKSSSSPPRNP